MSTTWQPLLQPNTTPAVDEPIWRTTFVLGPVVSFEMMSGNGHIGFAQAYPVGTGDTVSSRVEFVMEHNIGPFQFGVREESEGPRLLVRMASARDVAAFSAMFPEVTA